MQALLEGVGPEGAVYVSMGTLCNFGQAEFSAIAAALSGLPHRVIWKLAPGDLPGNSSIADLGLAPNIKASFSFSWLLHSAAGILGLPPGLQQCRRGFYS